MKKSYKPPETTIVTDTDKYTVLKDDYGRCGIKCKRCNSTSWNPDDVLYKYCAKCNLFIETVDRLLT